MTLLSVKDYRKLAGDKDTSDQAVETALAHATAAIGGFLGADRVSDLTSETVLIDSEGYGQLMTPHRPLEGEVQPDDGGRVFVGAALVGARVTFNYKQGGKAAQGPLDDSTKDLVVKAAKRFLSPSTHPSVPAEAINTEGDIPFFNEGWGHDVLLTEVEQEKLAAVAAEDAAAPTS